jgi:hypothetical protein
MVLTSLQTNDPKNEPFLRTITKVIQTLSLKEQNQNDLLGIGAIDLIMKQVQEKSDSMRTMVLCSLKYLSNRNRTLTRVIYLEYL